MDARRKRLLFRARHCGIKENDELFGGFAESELETLSEEHLSHFEALLAAPDQDAYKWVTGAVPVPKAYDTELFYLIQNFNKLA